MTGLVQIFGSSPAVQPSSQAFRVFTIFLAVFPSPATPGAGSFLPFAPFGTRWLQQIYFCSFKMLNGSLLFTAKTLSTHLAHLFFLTMGLNCLILYSPDLAVETQVSPGLHSASQPSPWRCGVLPLSHSGLGRGHVCLK